VIIRYANYFQDDLTLDNMPRMQLINLCKYMSISPYGSDSFLRFQLRHKIRALRQDDQKILWEGIDSLTKMELREACQERGMRSTGLSKDAYKGALQQWLFLSVNKNVPISLLIMSRTFFLREEERAYGPQDTKANDLSGLADAISGLDKEVLNEVILEVATPEEKVSDPEITKLKLDVLSQQNERIREEEAAREAAVAKKKSEAAEKSKEELVVGARASDVITGDESVPMPSGVFTVEGAKAEPVPSVSTEGALAEEAASAAKETAEQKTKEDYTFSAQEIEALSQLLSTDPVSKEREELEKIKASSSDHKVSSTDTEGEVGFSVGQEEVDDPVVARLKKRIDSMVGKIEVQINNAKQKIGDKLHLLDRDQDGILSREEMAEVLQQVFKRKITADEAMVVASKIVSFGRKPGKRMFFPSHYLLFNFVDYRTKTVTEYSLWMNSLVG
jgi:LETM1 and EF-hand domain-containing protein 1, mitochondrial